MHATAPEFLLFHVYMVPMGSWISHANGGWSNGLYHYTGVLAAAGLVGLDNYRQNMERDHAMAGKLAAGLASLSAQLAQEAMPAAQGGGSSDPNCVRLVVHDVAVATNMVVFEIQGYRHASCGGSGAAAATAAFCEELHRRGIMVFPYGGRGDKIRAVTHRHIDAQAVDRVVAAVDDVLRGNLR